MNVDIKSRIKDLLKRRRDHWNIKQLTTHEVSIALGVDLQTAFLTLCDLCDDGEAERIVLEGFTIGRIGSCLAWRLK